MKEQDKILNSGMLEQYVLGLLEAEEMAEVESYMEKYPELKQHVESVQEVMEQVLLQNGIAPPPHMRDQILSSIDELERKQPNNPPKTSRSSLRIMPLLASLAALGLVVLSFGFFQRLQQKSNDYKLLSERYENLQKGCEAKKAIAEAERDFLMKPTTRAITLSGSPSTKAPDAHVIVHFNEAEQAALLNVVNLPEVPKDKTYQLWADVAGHMESMGTFDGTSLALQTVDFLDNANSLNITLEPLGGSTEATVEQLQASGRI
ncbi:MAG: anti-sigma factor [Bacteroidota bacterium]